MNNRPFVSVIMGVFNCGETLDEALECIINQTYDKWEIIMCDDASTDNTRDVAEKYVKEYPEKIHLLYNDSNQGLNYTLNRCLEVAKGEFIARMDGDDRCSLDRFEKEIEAFNTYPDISIVSSDMAFFDENGVWGQTRTIVRPEPRDFAKETQFCHAACMVRKAAYDAVGGYTVDKRLLRVEDYHLWIKMYEKGYRGINIREPLYQMRDDRKARSRKLFKYRLNEAYVKYLAVKKLKLPVHYYVHCIKPIIIGLMPRAMYDRVHHASKHPE